MSPPTFASRLTPSGRGAVATIVVAGADAAACVAHCFPAANKRADWAVGQLRYGRWRLGTVPPQQEAESRIPLVEELVVCRTAANRFEVHCHGGEAVVAAILRSLTDQGVCLRPWWEDDEDPAEPRWRRQLRIELAQAPTERVCCILLDQYHGALAKLLTRLHAAVSGDTLTTVQEQLRGLLADNRLGLHLTQPWRVVLCGPPNVGKSSLINRLLGFERAVVFDQPGTTRDVVRARTALAGWPLELSDTAGVRADAGPLEQQGIGLAREEIAAADLVLGVVAPDTSNSQLRELVAQLPHPLWVFNKLDQLPADGPSREDLAQILGQTPIAVSARTGAGLDELLRAIEQRLVPSPPLPGAPILCLPDQREWVEQAACAHSTVAETRALLAECLR